MNYQPNFNDPRTLKRVKTALGFVGACLSNTKPRQWSTRYISKHLGRTNEDLGNWLRERLLICTNDQFFFGEKGYQCKTYIRNKNGYNELLGLVNTKSASYPIVRQVETSIITDWIQVEFNRELATKDFKYEEKSNRYWHDLQFVKRDYKRLIFASSGLTYQYDIQCCAPTLIHQYSQMLDDPMDLYLVALNKFLKNRKEVRQDLATQTNISYDQAKEIINALLMGAQLGYNKDSDIYKMFDGDPAIIDSLKKNQFLKELRNDMKTCWEYIKPTLPVVVITDKNQKQRRLPMSSKQKAGVYFDLERRVINSVRSYLDKTGNQYFLEHDGWVCTKQINEEELIEHIKNSTGFKIQLESAVL